MTNERDSADDVPMAPATAPDLSCEEFAQVLAHLQHFADVPASEVLGQLRVSPPAFTRASNRWPIAIATETSPERSLASAFVAALAASQSALRGSAKPLASVAPLRAEVRQPAFHPIRDFRVDLDSTCTAVPTVGPGLPFRAGPADSRGLQSFSEPPPAPRARPPVASSEETAVPAAHSTLQPATPFEQLEQRYREARSPRLPGDDPRDRTVQVPILPRRS